MTKNAAQEAPTYHQASSAPIRKITTGAAAGALTIIIVWIFNEFKLLGNHEITSEIAQAITTFLTFIAAYLIPPDKADNIIPKT